MNLESASIGIIGGADGPTAIILSGNAAVLAQVLMVMAAAWIGYLLGSLMFGIIVSKCLYHDDVRNHGSGNAGMTNILRTYGKGAAALTLIGDMGKHDAGDAPGHGRGRFWPRRVQCGRCGCCCGAAGPP